MKMKTSAKELIYSAIQKAIEDGLVDSDGNLRCRMWEKDGEYIATPENIVLAGGRRVEMAWERGVGYLAEEFVD